MHGVLPQPTQQQKPVGEASLDHPQSWDPLLAPPPQQYGGLAGEGMALVFVFERAAKVV